MCLHHVTSRIYRPLLLVDILGQSTLNVTLLPRDSCDHYKESSYEPVGITLNVRSIHGLCTQLK